MIIIGERLKQLRKEKNVTQKAVAIHLGVAETTYQQFEYGSYRPGLPKLIALADYFNVSLDYLVGRSSNPTPPAP